jgi:hypothetical protein
MPSLRASGRLVAAIGLLAVAFPTSALASTGHHVKAHAAEGEETVLVYPSLVNARLVRAQAALERAAKHSDEAQPAQAIIDLTAARENLSKAWSGAKYVIEHAPPPPPAEEASAIHRTASIHRSAFMRSGRLRIYKPVHPTKHHKKGLRLVHKSGGAVGPTPATIYDTAFAVLSLEHYAATTTVGLIDNSFAANLLAVRSTLARSLNERDAAIAFIHSIDVTPPTEEEEEEETAGWSTTMPNAIPQLQDEIQQAEGTLAEPNLTGEQTSILQGAEYRDLKTDRTLTAFWPPKPEEE